MKIKSLLILLLIVSVFAITGCSSRRDNDENIKIFSESIDLANSATEILNKAGGENRQLSAEEYLKFLEYQKSALNKAKMVNIEKLNKNYKDFGDQYKNNFIGGLELTIPGWEERENNKLIPGQVLDHKWDDWYSDNINNIKESKSLF